MKIKFTKDFVSEASKPEKIKKRKWDRWLYLAILFIILASFFQWLITPVFFDYAHGILLQEQHDVQFTDDVQILEYCIHEDQNVKTGDTLFSYDRYTDNLNKSNNQIDSLQIILDQNDRNVSLIAIEGQIEKRKLFLQSLNKRLNYWKAEKIQKEKLVYLNVITPNELSNIDRSIDHVNYEIATTTSEYKTLMTERTKLLQSISNSNQINLKSNSINQQKKYYMSPFDGRIDRIIVPENQVYYKPNKVFSIIKPNYFVRAYIEMTDLDEFEVGDDVVIVLPYGNNKLAGKVNKMYAVSEQKADVVIDDKDLIDYKHGVVIEIKPLNNEGWDKLKVSNIPVKVRKGKLKIK